MFRAPRFSHMPAVSFMLHDIPANTAQIAKHLDLKESTLKTYLKTGFAPRPVMLALYWETKWGVSNGNVQAHNDAVMQASVAASYKRQVEKLSGVIWSLEQELAQDSGTRPANLPVFQTR